MTEVNNKIEEKNLRQLVFDMIKGLSQRAGDIIIKRFNLDGKGGRTLEDIGREYGVTRERIRQIEVESILKLKETAENYGLGGILDDIKQTVQDSGGIMSEEKIAGYLFGGKGDRVIDKQMTLLILSLDDKIRAVRETAANRKFYYYNQNDVEKFKLLTGKLKKHLEENKEVMSFEKIVGMANENAENILSEKAIKSYLDANKIVLENVLGEWGLEKWTIVNPKCAKDKAYLALKKIGKPLHFSAIADKINEIWHNEKKANHQTVHNELIKDKRFVLVGRGIYALEEWGYKPGTVLDVILEILKDKKERLGQEEIVQEVLKKRQVKRNTIILNLQNRRYFEKLQGKVYKLKEV